MPGCGDEALPLGLLRVACDEVVVHVEEADPQQVEDDVQPVAQSHRLVVGLPEGCEGALLWAQKNVSVALIRRGNNGSDFKLITTKPIRTNSRVICCDKPVE